MNIMEDALQTIPATLKDYPVIQNMARFYDKHQPQRIIYTFATRLNKQLKNFSIRLAQQSDVEAMVKLSYTKRRAYEQALPQFWRYAGESAEVSQAEWFGQLLKRDDYIMLSALQENTLIGFAIGRLISAPEVYDPGGLTLMIDDFCMNNTSDWSSAGQKLVTEIKELAKKKGAAQILVVCGAHDQPKRSFLKSMGLNIASEWYVGEIL
jgi:hypothetical protein